MAKITIDDDGPALQVKCDGVVISTYYELSNDRARHERRLDYTAALYHARKNPDCTIEDIEQCITDRINNQAE